MITKEEKERYRYANPKSFMLGNSLWTKRSKQDQEEMKRYLISMEEYWHGKHTKSVSESKVSKKESVPDFIKIPKKGSRGLFNF